MKRQYLLIGICGLFAAVLPAAAQQQAYVLLPNGQRMVAKDIEAVDGGLKITTPDGGSMTIKNGHFRGAYVPLPQPVAALEKLYDAKQYDKVVQYAPQTMQRFGMLGWGDKIAYLEGSAHLARKEPEKAVAAFERGKRFKGRQEGDLERGRVLAMLALGRLEEVRTELDAMVRSKNKEDAAMAFNARGRILDKEGKSKEAVLEYLKTLLLFDKDEESVKPFRDEARKEVVELMRKMGDPKWRMFVDME